MKAQKIHTCAQCLCRPSFPVAFAVQCAPGAGRFVLLHSSHEKLQAPSWVLYGAAPVPACSMGSLTTQGFSSWLLQRGGIALVKEIRLHVALPLHFLLAPGSAARNLGGMGLVLQRTAAVEEAGSTLGLIFQAVGFSGLAS